jgi:hypothetical protein
MGADIFHTEILNYTQVTNKYTFATRARMRRGAGPYHVWRLVTSDETQSHATCGGWCFVTKRSLMPRVVAGVL